VGRRGAPFTRSSGSIASDIRLRRSQFGGTICLVEGPTDARALGQFVDRPRCQVVAADNRDNVLNVVTMLRAEGITGLVGIVDADYGHIVGSLPSAPDIIVTNLHDLEMSLVQSAAFDRVLWARGSPTKIGRAIARWGGDLRPLLLGAAAPIGALRLYSERHRVALRFKNLDFGSFVDVATFQTGHLELCTDVRNKSMRHDLDVAELAGFLEQTLAEGHDPWQLCCGHDVTEILRLALRKSLGSQRPSSITAASLEMDLALACDRGEFMAWPLVHLLLDWESRNSPFQIFA
jgi:Protein of unknown function (DUF4435)